jgi:serine O-acetyltransferase
VSDQVTSAAVVAPSPPADSAEDMAAASDRAVAPGFWTLVKEDHLVNGKDWTLPGFRAMFMYRFGVWRMNKPKLIRMPLSVIYRWMYRRVRNRYGIELHYTAKIGRRFRIAHQGAIVIHEHAVIGDDCTIRQGVTIGSTAEYDMQGPTLGNRVDVGAGAMILGRVRVGDGARIGANAVVMMNVPAGAMAVAQPARIMTPPSGGASRV